MASFIVVETTTYEVEAENRTEAQSKYRRGEVSMVAQTAEVRSADDE